MSNVLSDDGIKSGSRINRECVDCKKIFESWSDDTMTIKGPTHPSNICNECNKLYIIKHEEYLQYSFSKINK